MKKEYINIGGKLEKCHTFTNDELKGVLGSSNWDRTLMSAGIFEKIGLGVPKQVFLVAGSRSDMPSKTGKVAGICSLRNDEKDLAKGYPINGNHWDFIQYGENKIVMVLRKDKLKSHWFTSVEEWKNSVEECPPHKN